MAVRVEPFEQMYRFVDGGAGTSEDALFGWPLVGTRGDRFLQQRDDTVPQLIGNIDEAVSEVFV